MVRRGHLIGVVGTFLIGCAVLLLVVGCSGTRSDVPQEEKRQEHTEATKEQPRSPEATASEEEARCQGTRTIKRFGASFVTNDVPGCPKGGLLEGTEGSDNLYGGDGDDEIRGLGGADDLEGGPGSDIIYGGAGGDDLWGEQGEDVLYGGDGNDSLGDSTDGQRDKLYCGKGKDRYFVADKEEYVDSSCEKKLRPYGRAMRTS